MVVDFSSHCRIGREMLCLPYAGFLRQQGPQNLWNVVTPPSPHVMYKRKSKQNYLKLLDSGWPPPPFGQCPKERRFSLWMSLKSSTPNPCGASKKCPRLLIPICKESLTQSTLHNSQCTLPTAHCTMHNAHSTLPTAHCTLHTAHCTLQTARCTLHTAHCTLHTAHWNTAH